MSNGEKMKRKIFITKTRKKLNRVSDHIRGSLKRQHMTQTQMSDKLGIKQQTLSKWLEDPTRITLENFFDMMEILGEGEKEVSELLCEE